MTRELRAAGERHSSEVHPWAVLTERPFRKHSVTDA